MMDDRDLADLYALIFLVTAGLIIGVGWWLANPEGKKS